ncbi:MAG: type III pantothenate kinase [Bacteroidia bacterium]|nr:type III pantothenate kinase [Bacteroidia bacterium]
MLLTVDVGNTLIAFGVYEKSQLVATFKTASDVKKSLDEYVSTIETFIQFRKLDKALFEGAIISSVVPILTEVIKTAVFSAFGLEAVVLTPGLKTGLPILIDHPNELGSDLVADSVGAIAKYGAPLTIVDLGTAIKMLAIDDKGAFVGATFYPGLYVAVDALIGRAAQLSRISLSKPKKVIGKNTKDSMNAGAIYGTAGMINGLLKHFEDELGYKTTRVITGGDAIYVKELLPDFIYDEFLILDGLRVIYERNEVRKNAK